MGLKGVEATRDGATEAGLAPTIPPRLILPGLSHVACSAPSTPCIVFD